MDDQFGGRTDDDLFADDFEPVTSSAEQEPSEYLTAQEVQDAPRPEVAAVEPPIERPAEEAPNQEIPSNLTTSASIPTASTPPTAPRSLAQSRHNRPPPSSRPPRQPPSTNNSTTPSVSSTIPTAPSALTPSTTAPTPTAPEKYDPATRLQSGANPRTKLTDEELAAKMEQMRILSAEKTRRFEQAQRDESDHRIALARSVEETRKRRAAEEEKRRRGEEDRRRMDEERAKNRERKLQAMGQKEGGWDEGKEERLAEEERRGFRGANGGVVGTKSVGLAGSRYAADDGFDDRREFGGDRGGRGRGRGRGSTRGGRGGRGGLYEGYRDSDRNDGAAQTAAARPKPAPAAMTKDEFPALPAALPSAETITKVPPPIQNPISPLSPGIGKWDDEMAAIDAQNTRKL